MQEFVFILEGCMHMWHQTPFTFTLILSFSKLCDILEVFIIFIWLHKDRLQCEFMKLPSGMSKEAQWIRESISLSWSNSYLLCKSCGRFSLLMYNAVLCLIVYGTGILNYCYRKVVVWSFWANHKADFEQAFAWWRLINKVIGGVFDGLLA